MKNRAVFLFRQYWNRAGSPLKAELRWVRHILLGRVIDGKENPKADVSVIIPCHNYAKTLPRAIESVLKQTMRPLEILVVDDASDDDTAAVVNRYASKGVSYLRTEHQDLSYTRNSGSASTTGRFMLYLDADDYLPPDYIEQCLDSMKDEKTGLAYGNIRYVREKHTFIESPSFDATLLGRFNFISSNALIRRQAFDLAGGYRSIPHSMEDWDFHRRVIAHGYRAAKADTFAYYDIHEGSLTNIHKRGTHASYSHEAALLHQPLMIFTLFTETFDAIDEYLSRIEAAGFDPALLHLFWYNACDDTAFDALLRSKLASSRFGSLQYVYAPETPHTPEEHDLLHIRAWHRMLRPDTADYVLSLSPAYPLPAHGIPTMFSHLQEDICGLFAPCNVHRNGEHDGRDFLHNPCFCCAVIRRGSMDNIIPWQTDAQSNSLDSFSLTAYRRLRRQAYVLHCKDMWQRPTIETEQNTQLPLDLPMT